MYFWGEIIRLSIKWHFKLNNKNLRRGIRFILCCCREGAGASTGNSKFLLLKLLMFLQATKSIIPVQTCWKSNSQLLGDFNEGVHIDCMVIVLGFAATVKNVPDIFFHLNHGSSFLEHAEYNSPCSTLQRTLSTYAKCYYCSSFRSDLRRDDVCSKELQAVHCGIFIVTNLKYISVRKYI